MVRVATTRGNHLGFTNLDRHFTHRGEKRPAHIYDIANGTTSSHRYMTPLLILALLVARGDFQVSLLSPASLQVRIVGNDI